MNVEKLKELIKTEFDIVNAEEKVSKIAETFKEGRAVLVEEDKKIVGVVRERDLVKGIVLKNPRETKIKSIMIKTGTIPIEELDVEKVVRRFVEDSTPFVLIRMKDKLGTIYIDDFLDKLKDELSNVKVSEAMSSEVVTIKSFETVAKALAKMRDGGIDRLVVVDDMNKVVGVVTIKDIVERILSPRKRARYGEVSGEKKSLAIMVESVMSSPVITVKKEDQLVEAINLMLENRISSLVVTKNGIPEGILVKKDILQYYLKKFKRKEKIVIQFISQELDVFDVEMLRKGVEKFMRKFFEFLGETSILVHLEQHKDRFRKLPLVHVRIRVVSERGTFMVTGEGWGVEYALHTTLKKLEREIVKEKEMIKGKRALRRIYKEFFE
ncbi:MAG: CBS domain-containing protein [Archaeoglobaceae archaeon]|nr:CBS domain-containing protein [Archaeoglobaceae archaeon]MCX8152392.1 CBS domain-containing protein [Archaeoglobaceae archaeon]MDW8013732.1 CBS domain-containing protein [Archaeoglobaceae archaeon]